MNLSNESVATAFRVLGKYSSEVKPAGPWRWRCVVQNGARLPLAASIEEGFLQLAGTPEVPGQLTPLLERALRANASLAGGVKFALDAASRGLLVCVDLVLLDELQMLARLPRVLEGFHQAYSLLPAIDSPLAAVAARGEAADLGRLLELLHETAWACTERGPNDFVVAIESASAPPARITVNELGVMFTLDMARSAPSLEAVRLALAVFLLTSAGRLRLVRPIAVEEQGGQMKFGFQVCLPPAPAAEEIHHALGALSMASRMCGPETSVLSDEAAARCYLSVRSVPLTLNLENEKEMTNYG
jgi:hypothetical protein